MGGKGEGSGGKGGGNWEWGTPPLSTPSFRTPRTQFVHISNWVVLDVKQLAKGDTS